MLVDKFAVAMANVLIAIFIVYLFFLYFGIFFTIRQKSIRVIVGVALLMLWQLIVPEIIRTPSGICSIGVTVVLTLFAAINVFVGRVWMKCFFAVAFSASRNVGWKFADNLRKEHRGTADVWSFYFNTFILADNSSVKEGFHK